MRINQFVAAASGLSRRAADTAIAAGRVSVNGRPAQTGEQITPPTEVQLDGHILKLPLAHRLIMLNKPEGYVSSRRRQGTASTIYELLPSQYHDLRPVGRLDRDSSGLMLLTDDGDFIQRHTHPSYRKDKVYELTLARPVTSTDRHRLEQGIELDDGSSRVIVDVHEGAYLRVRLSEGRNRQLRRTLGALGYTVKRLHRLQIGPYQLGVLPPGHWQALSYDGAPA
jgi:23S rRNA pseudouridine2605 synthase